MARAATDALAPRWGAARRLTSSISARSEGGLRRLVPVAAVAAVAALLLPPPPPTRPPSRWTSMAGLLGMAPTVTLRRFGWC